MCVYTHIHTHTHTRARARTHTHTHTHTLIHIRTHTYITHNHTQHTHTHTHPHTYTQQVLSLQKVSSAILQISMVRPVRTAKTLDARAAKTRGRTQPGQYKFQITAPSFLPPPPSSPPPPSLSPPGNQPTNVVWRGR